MEYVADYETTKNDDETMRVWLWDICTVGGDFEHVSGKDLTEFFSVAYELENPTIFFHNYKFDGSYILNWLHVNGYSYVEQGNAPMTYTVLVTDRGIWFCGSCTNAEGKTINFRDSLKKIPLKVQQIPKAYGLEQSKGEIDYKKPRHVGYEPDELELEYVRHDTEIVARAIKQHFDKGLTAMTAPADAMNDYKERVNFDSLFIPKFWKSHPDIERYCRRAYCGGISWVNPDIKEKEVRHGFVYDYNSMYPSVMLAYPFPHGYPVRFYKNPPKGKLYIARVKVDISRRPGKLACMRNPILREWIEDEYQGELYLTNVDVECLQNCYYGEAEILDGYAFNGEIGLFDSFINTWAEIKRTTTGGQRQIAKLMQNSFYGKFGTNPERAHKIPVFVDGILKWRNAPPEMGKSFSIPVACFVTAYARRELMRGVDSCTGFCYCDTDSVHVASLDGKAAKFTGNVHPTDYGAWKLEARFVRAKYLRQKTYIEECANGKLLIAACGCPATSRNYITFDNFAMGASYKGKLVPKMRVGGAELVERRFTVREPFRKW